MKTLQQNETRVERYLTPRMGRLREMIRERLVDPRRARGKTIDFDSMLLAMIAGVVGGRKTLRDVEHLSERLGLGAAWRAHQRQRDDVPAVQAR